MRSRKGLSTVVGMIFALIALATSVGYITYSMNILDQFNQTVIAKNQQTIDTGRENFQLYTATIKNNKLNVTVINTGSIPINITRMWVQNTSATDWVNYYPIIKGVYPGTTLTHIGENIGTVYPTNAYNLKLITSRGNSLQFTLNALGTKPLYMQLTITPQQAVGNLPRNVTILYQVTNNSTSNNLLTNIQANVTCNAVTASPIPAGQFIFKGGPFPAQYATLPAGNTVIFKWIYQIGSSGVISGQSRYCVAKLVNGLATNTASDSVWWVSP